MTSDMIVMRALLEVQAMDYLQSKIDFIKELREDGWDKSFINEQFEKFNACRDMVEAIFKIKIDVVNYTVCHS